MMMELNAQRMEDFKGRYRFFIAASSVAFSLIVVSLWYLQVIRGSEFKRMSMNNCIRIRENPAPRGMILDRKGRVLALNRPSFEVYLVPEDLKEDPEALLKAGRTLNIDPEELKEKLQSQRKRAPFRPVRIKSDIEWSELARVEMGRIHLPGVYVEVRPRRTYPHGPLASHLIGYLGEVDDNELRRPKGPPYRMGAMIGKYGVEYECETYLRGVDGGRQIEVDVLGREIRHLRSVEPLPGQNVTLTIDLDLQKEAEEAFEGKTGALVAMDPKSGRILAMVSKPSFDPDLFAGSISPEEWKSLVEDPFSPLQNKGIQGQYPPGSVFKIVTAIAGLETGAIVPQTLMTCRGVYPYGNRDFRCWKEEGHGTVNLHRAMVESCDIYFYQVGLKVGVDAIAHYAQQFGLGSPTGIALPHEKAGIVPSSSWKKRRLGDPWYSGETLSLAIGQGYISTTPLQLLVLISAIANGGRLYLPQVVEKVEDVDGNLLKVWRPWERGMVGVSEKSLQIIQRALMGAVNEPGATGRACLLKHVNVAGKTGTAQVIRMAQDFKRGDMERLPLRFRDHAWFVAYAPFEDPAIAVVVLVEHGGYGGAAAAPIAKKVIEKYLALEALAPSKMVSSSAESN